MSRHPRPSQDYSPWLLTSKWWFFGMLAGSSLILFFGVMDTGRLFQDMHLNLDADRKAYEISVLAQKILKESCMETLRGKTYDPGGMEPMEIDELKSSPFKADGRVLSRNSRIGDFQIESIQLVKTAAMNDGRHLASVVMNLRRDEPGLGTMGASTGLYPKLVSSPRLTQTFPIYVKTDSNRDNEIVDCGQIDEDSPVLEASANGQIEDEGKKLEKLFPDEPIDTKGKMIEITPIRFEGKQDNI